MAKELVEPPVGVEDGEAFEVELKPGSKTGYKGVREVRPGEFQAYLYQPDRYKEGKQQLLHVTTCSTPREAAWWRAGCIEKGVPLKSPKKRARRGEGEVRCAALPRHCDQVTGSAIHVVCFSCAHRQQSKRDVP